MVKKAAAKPAPKVSQPVAPIRTVEPQEEEAPRKPAKVAAPIEPKDVDLDEDLAEDDLEIEGEIEEEAQEELDLDDEDDADDLIEKSENLLDDHDDYRNN